MGFVPTRRSIFSAPDAIKYANLTRKKLTELDVEFVDITDINEEGLFYDEADREVIQAKFRAAGVKGIFFPHCNFGTEYVCARLAKDMGLPVLLWGPRDERPDENGVRLRDSQCGLFATGKVLRRFRVPFTYMTNCRLEDEEFVRGLFNFLAVCNVVDVFHHTRILQIGPRPFDFWSTMCNEGELLEKFNIQLSPVPLSELTSMMKTVREDCADEVQAVVDYCTSNMNICVKPEELTTIAVLKVAMRKLAEKYGCNAGAIQCWNALQTEIGIMPCAANSLLNEEGFPVVCETDIHGAITALLVEAASLNETRSFFADWTMRHPDNENGELLQHCGPWPISVAQEKPTIGYPLAFDHPGAVEAQAKFGDVTLVRFDGDNGEYSMLLGNAKGIEGPYTKGTYLWVEVQNLKRLEAKLVEGPYIHHCVGIHENVVPVLYEACKYIGVTPDLYDPIEEDVKAYLRGE
ncbi:MAG: L-fucose/L-arabinose isomerase family protein [Lachnospiraceae bacterium]|nr:L-fucose/L-arabinose isomerase family protein [Lachnospiraceae bacterium]